MGYRLADNTGDTLAVPQLVLTHLCQTDARCSTGRVPDCW